MTRVALPTPGGSMGEKLRQAREERGWGQVETVARAAELMPPNGRKVTQGLYSSYELDKVKFPDRGIVGALAQVLELDADDLLSRTAWGRGREFMSGYPKSDSILINAPSPTMLELMRVIDRLDADELEAMLQYGRGLVARRTTA